MCSTCTLTGIGEKSSGSNGGNNLLSSFLNHLYRTVMSQLSRRRLIWSLRISRYTGDLMSIEPLHSLLCLKHLYCIEKLHCGVKKEAPLTDIKAIYGRQTQEQIAKVSMFPLLVYDLEILITSPPIGGGRGIVMPMSVCLCVCLFVCLFVCVFVCLFFRVFAKFQCNISAISQPIIMKLGIHITYGYTVTDKYFQNFRSKVKVVGRRKVKNVIWPYLGNEWS